MLTLCSLKRTNSYFVKPLGPYDPKRLCMVTLYPFARRIPKSHAVKCVFEDPPQVVKFLVQEHAFVGEECYTFYAEDQLRPEGADLMNGPALATALGELGVKFFLHDMWVYQKKLSKIILDKVEPPALRAAVNDCLRTGRHYQTLHLGEWRLKAITSASGVSMSKGGK